MPVDATIGLQEIEVWNLGPESDDPAQDVGVNSLPWHRPNMYAGVALRLGLDCQDHADLVWVVGLERQVNIKGGKNEPRRPRTEFIQIFSFLVNRHRGARATPAV